MVVSKLFRAVILGAPASGKGTISDKISKCFNMEHISSGDLLRDHVHNKSVSELGDKLKFYMDKGELVPDNIISTLIFSELAKRDNVNWVLDGFPRSEKQAIELLAKYPINVAISIVVPCDVIVERVQGRWVHLASGRVYNTDFKPPQKPGKDDITGEPLVQRADDKPDAVRKRLEVYKRTVEPLCEFYRSKGILIEVHGHTSEHIWRQLQKYLESKLKPVYES